MPYVYANVKVKYGELPAFFEQMVTIKRVMEKHGWKLVGAWSTLIGDLHEVHDLWEVEDANIVPNAFAAAYEDPEFVAAAESLLPYQEPDGSWKVDTGGMPGAPATYGTTLATYMARRCRNSPGPAPGRSVPNAQQGY